MIIYNEARGLLFHRLELIGLTGSTIFGEKPVIWTQYSQDGVSWSTEKRLMPVNGATGANVLSGSVRAK